MPEITTFDQFLIILPAALILIISFIIYYFTKNKPPEDEEPPKKYKPGSLNINENYKSSDWDDYIYVPA